jgi:hypothetical protein
MLSCVINFFFCFDNSFDNVLFRVPCLEVVPVAIATRFNHEDFGKGGMTF